MTDRTPRTAIHARIDSDIADLLDATLEGLSRDVIRVSRANFIQSAIEHYADHLAELHNDGKRWGSKADTVDLDELRSVSGSRRGIRIPADWARVADRDDPQLIYLCQKQGAHLIDVGRIDVGAFGDPGRERAFTYALRRAGYEPDPAREQRADDYGNELVPIRYAGSHRKA